MKFTRPILLFIVAFIAFAAASGSSAFGAEKPEVEAQKAAEQWLGLVDNGKYAESWKTAAPAFQSAISSEKWVSALDSVRKPLGGLVSRKLKSAAYTKTLPGAPDGEYVIIQFEATFAEKKSAIETAVPMLDKDGKWKVSGYFIK